MFVLWMREVSKVCVGWRGGWWWTPTEALWLMMGSGRAVNYHLLSCSLAL